MNFDKMLLETAASIVRARPENISEEIGATFKKTGDFFGLGRIILAELTLGDDGPTGVLCSYVGKNRPASSKTVIDQDALLTGIVAKIRDIKWSREKTPSEPFLTDFIPIKIGNERGVALCAGFGDLPQEVFFFGSHNNEFSWTGEVLSGLRSFAVLIVSALERKNLASRILQDAAELKEKQKHIHELLSFEHLLSEISATYIKLPANQIEKVIRFDLGRLGKLMKADRCMFFTKKEGDDLFRFESPFVWWDERDEAIARKNAEFTKSNPQHFFNKHRYFFDKWSRDEVVQLSSVDSLPEDAGDTRDFLERFHTKSVLSIPISVDNSFIGVLYFVTIRKHRTWPEELYPRLRLFGEVFMNAMARKQSAEKLQTAFDEIKHLKQRIEADYIYLREEIDTGNDIAGIIGKSELMKSVVTKIRQIAPTDVTTLILGETGTGKSLIAKAIHNMSSQRERPLIQVNCATLTPTLIESELFGHEKGAFTGAQARRVGRFELANGTTLFLDEIGELPLELQPKLLRVLQDGEFERVGGNVTLKTNVRLIAATNRDLEKEVEKGRFRADLWYRLNIFPLHVPPLRERVEDIPLFVNHFVERYGKKVGKTFEVISRSEMKVLESYPWPGNIRELENMIERAAITSEGKKLQLDVMLPNRLEAHSGNMETLEEIERQHILKVLAKVHGKINGPGGAAEYLGLHPETLRSRIRKLGIKRKAS